VKYAAIADWAADKQFSVTFMCAQLGVTRQGYYRWLADGPCERERTDAELTKVIREIHTQLHGHPGVRRVWAKLVVPRPRSHSELAIGGPPNCRQGSEKPQVSAVHNRGVLVRVRPRTRFRGIPATSDVPALERPVGDQAARRARQAQRGRPSPHPLTRAVTAANHFVDLVRLSRLTRSHQGRRRRTATSILSSGRLHMTNDLTYI
jgi:hypothetical protein